MPNFASILAIILTTIATSTHGASQTTSRIVANPIPHQLPTSGIEYTTPSQLDGLVLINDQRLKGNNIDFAMHAAKSFLSAEQVQCNISSNQLDNNFKEINEYNLESLVDAGLTQINTRQSEKIQLGTNKGSRISYGGYHSSSDATPVRTLNASYESANLYTIHIPSISIYVRVNCIGHFNKSIPREIADEALDQLALSISNSISYRTNSQPADTQTPQPSSSTDNHSAAGSETREVDQITQTNAIKHSASGNLTKAFQDFSKRSLDQSIATALGALIAMLAIIFIYKLPNFLYQRFAKGSNTSLIENFKANLTLHILAIAALSLFVELKSTEVRIDTLIPLNALLLTVCSAIALKSLSSTASKKRNTTTTLDAEESSQTHLPSPPPKAVQNKSTHFNTPSNEDRIIQDKSALTDEEVNLIYSEIQDEIECKNFDQALWLRAEIEADGDFPKQRLIYAKAKFAQKKKEIINKRSGNQN